MTRPPMISPTDSLQTIARRLYAIVEVACEHGELRHVTADDHRAFVSALYPQLAATGETQGDDRCDLCRAADELGIDLTADHRCCAFVAEEETSHAEDLIERAAQIAGPVPCDAFASLPIDRPDVRLEGPIAPCGCGPHDLRFPEPLHGCDGCERGTGYCNCGAPFNPVGLCPLSPVEHNVRARRYYREVHGL